MPDKSCTENQNTSDVQ